MSVLSPNRRFFLLLFFLLLCILIVVEARKHRRRHVDGDQNRTRKRKFSSEIRIVDFNDNFTFSANETWLHVRTENAILDYKTCLEYRIHVEGKRTRYVFLKYLIEKNKWGYLIFFSYCLLAHMRITFLVIRFLAKKRFGKIRKSLVYVCAHKRI